jgi:flagellar hook assembly protein FlgD
VITLANDIMNEGEHDIIWDGRNANGDEMATGIYFYRFRADDFVDTKKMILLK